MHGETLGLLDQEPGDSPAAWRELGRDLALLHTHVTAQWADRRSRDSGLPDPRPWLDQIAQEGYFTPMEARWLLSWLDWLAPAALASTPRCFLHGDIQTTNMLVRAGSLDYLAVIDWGSAGWGDPAWDFAWRTVARGAFAPPRLSRKSPRSMTKRLPRRVSYGGIFSLRCWCCAVARYRGDLGRAPAGDAAGDYALH